VRCKAIAASDQDQIAAGLFLPQVYRRQYLPIPRIDRCHERGDDIFVHRQAVTLDKNILRIDLFGGQVQVMFEGMPSLIEYIKTGKLRPLAVTTTTRSEALPDIPTVGDFVPGFESSQWFGVGAPRNTAAGIIDTLNKEINTALADPKAKARLADLGGTVLAGSPADFGKFIADETEKWGKVIRAANVRAD
jgi:tripartite-type tricarboxylate transporter receptor subunit TctC